MENRKDIGQAISEKLNSLDKTPREQVWSGISDELQKKKKRRIGFFFFWITFIGLITISTFSGLFLYDHYNGNNWFRSNKSHQTIPVDSANKETAATSSNDKNDNKTSIKNDESKMDKNVLYSKSTADKSKTNSNNSTANNNSLNNSHSDTNSNLTKSKEDNTSVKSLKKRKSNTTYFKSIKNESKYLSKAGKKLNEKVSKNTKNSVKKQTTDKTLTEKETVANSSSVDLSALQKASNQSNSSTTKTTSLRDLSSLENKKTSKKDAIIAQKEKELKLKLRDSLFAKNQTEKERKAKTKDSLMAQKEKTININMYPKDSVNVDSVKVFRKIHLDVFVSPTLHGYLNNNSTLDSRWDSLSKKSEIKFSYGFGLTYDMTERLSIRIGYRKVNISYVTQGVTFSGSETTIENFRGIDYDPGVSNQTVFDAANFNLGGAPKTDITQKISYTEIPLEFKYLFLAKKIGLKSSFGFSYLLLNDNKVILNTISGYTQKIGKTKNLSPTSVSLNLGLEADYPIFRNVKIFVEPLFNYQLKAFSDKNYKPYIFGIHTGIRYSFNN